MADACYLTQEYFAVGPFEAFLLISSNVVLLPVILRAFYFQFYTRAYLYSAAFVASTIYHTCIIKGLGGITCVLEFCHLKLLDYAFSYSVLFSSLLLLVPFTAFHKLDGTEIKPDVTFIENWIIYSSLIYVTVTVGSINAFKPLSWLQIAIPLLVVILIVVFAWVHLNLVFGKRPKYDAIDLIVSVILAVIAVFFFLIEYHLSADTYWITHSLWHIFAGLSQLYLLESRNKKRSGCWVILPSASFDYLPLLLLVGPA